MISISLAACVSVGALAQSGEKQRKAKSPSQTAELTRFSIEEPKKDSGYETGPLHINYDDGTEIVRSLPPLAASTNKKTVFNDVGFSDVKLGADRQTLGWTVDVENCCTSYPIPLRLVIFRHGKVLHTFAQRQVVWSWMFLAGGEQVAIVFGPTHGSEVGDYRLYDVNTGKLVSEVWGDADTQALKPDAPNWAKQLQDHFHSSPAASP